MREHKAQGLDLPDGITPELYAGLWNEFTDDHRNGDARREKVKQMENALRCIRRMPQDLRPDIRLDVVYARETSHTVDSFTEFQRRYHGIRANEEYIYIYETTPDYSQLLYVINVTADSILTAIAELMDLLSRKF